MNWREPKKFPTKAEWQAGILMDTGTELGIVDSRSDPLHWRRFESAPDLFRLMVKRWSPVVEK